MDVGGGTVEYNISLVRTLGKKRLADELTGFVAARGGHVRCAKPTSSAADGVTQHLVVCKGDYPRQLDALQVSGGWGLTCAYFAQKEGVKIDVQTISATCLAALHGLA